MYHLAYVNGRYTPYNQAMVAAADRGYQFADGAYEVLGMHANSFIDEQWHYDRLAQSLQALQIDWPVSPAALAIIVREVRRRNKLRHGMMYIQVTRGVAKREHAFPTPAGKPSLVVAGWPVNRDAIAQRQRQGIAVVSQPDQRWQRCDIKSIALLANVLARQQALKAGAHEAWLVDALGYITEGTSSNAWLIDHNHHLMTRPTSPALLSGVTRHAIMALAKKCNWKVTQRSFKTEDVHKAKEAFITSSTAGITPVVRFDGTAIGDGKVGEIVKKLLHLYDKDLPRRFTN